MLDPASVAGGVGEVLLIFGQHLPVDPIDNLIVVNRRTVPGLKYAWLGHSNWATDA